MSPQNTAAMVADKFQKFSGEIHKVLYGCDDTVEDLKRAFLAGGHVLITGVPGIGKSLVAQLWGHLMGCGFAIKTMTPDVVPSDITGSPVYNPVDHRMDDVFGLFDPNKSIVLADEINRMPPKGQNAFLEVMQDREFRIGPNTYPMKRPFFVMSCRNPISQKGTYPLVEAWLDRVYVETFMGYTTLEEAVRLSQDDNHQTGNPIEAAGIKPVMERGEAAEMINFVRTGVKVSEPVSRYIARLVFATRPPMPLLKSDGKLYKQYMPQQWQKAGLIGYGDSNRAITMLTAVAKANAALEGRTLVTDSDVKKVAVSCMAHKLALNEQVEMTLPLGTNRQVIEELLEAVHT
jgi:MoxR-like ATPase